VVALILYLSPIFFFPSHFRFSLWFSYISFYLFYLFLFSFTPFINDHTSWMRKRSEYLLWWLCMVFIYVDLTSVEHSSLGFRVWNGEVCIVCSHVEEKMNCSRFLKCNMDSHIEFCLVLTHKTCSSKGKRLLIIHFNTFVWEIGSTFEKTTYTYEKFSFDGR
jgi:hypothetical protein